jgi:tricarballylate dehydrogenase
MTERNYDAVVVGGGNAALCAAIAAAEQGAKVVVIERAPEGEAGGNSRFTAGAFRVAYAGIDDLKTIMPDLSESELASTDFGQYTENDFFDDMFRVTQYRTDPDLVELLVRRSLDTLRWMRENGVRFVPIYGRQAFKVEGRFKFWGGLTVESSGGGPGLIDALSARARARGVDIVYGARAIGLIRDGFSVAGAKVRHDGAAVDFRSRAVVLAAGGFEANPEMRARYLGPGWELAKVRGTRFNTGDGIRMAMEAGAAPYGNWSGCHAVAWDRNAPEFGDLAVGDQFQKHSYPFGIVVNARGERFVDEGADYRNYTYAKYGQEILRQPGYYAWQVFDQRVQHLLRDEYRIKEITKVEADTLEDLAERMGDVDREGFLATVKAYNAAVRTDVAFDPNVKDGRGTLGLALPKSNWANPLDKPPYVAYSVACGITFTFGGLRVNTDAAVLDEDLEPIQGLFAAGELIGGLFYFNYPGGTGLTSGAVFGRIAGASAARSAAQG